MRRRIAPVLLLLLCAALPARLPAQGPAEHPYVGKRAITTYGTVLNDGTGKLDDKGRSRSLDVSGHDRAEFRVDKVDQSNGPWLWLIPEKGGMRGQAPAVNVIPLDEAVDRITAEIRANPASSYLYIRRANVWEARGELDIAISDLAGAIRLDSCGEMAWVNRGNAWSGKKEYDKAVADYSEAIRLDPEDVWAYNGRAWLWANCPDDKVRDGKQAVESATKACELNERKNADHLDTLAAAYAESGDFASAIEWQTKATALDGNGADLARWKDRLKLYEAKTPYLRPRLNRGRPSPIDPDLDQTSQSPARG